MSRVGMTPSCVVTITLSVRKDWFAGHLRPSKAPLDQDTNLLFVNVTDVTLFTCEIGWLVNLWRGKGSSLGQRE